MADSFTEEAPYESRELQNPSVIEAFAKGVMSFGYEAVRKFLRKKLVAYTLLSVNYWHWRKS